MGKKKCEECKQGAPAWMATFTDMNMLLMTFFILLLSMASMDKKKIKEAIGSLKGALGVLREGNKTEMTKQDIMSRLSFVDKVKSMQRRSVTGMKNYLEASKLSNVVSVVETKQGISLRIMDSVLFGKGDAEILPKAYPVLNKIAALILESPYNVLVEGHTDDIPYEQGKYPSNWELSTARAVNVVKYLITKDIKPQRLAAAGLAENHPLLPNITESNRAKNRRVEIDLISPEYAEANSRIFK